MPQVTISDAQYDVYATVEVIDQYLAGDLQRASAWAALTPEVKAQADVSATRLLQRQAWRDGVPPVEDAPLVVQQATALLAADIAAKPSLGDSASTGSNIKAVGAGSARVEFFSPVAGTLLPSAAWALLADLLGPAPGTLDSPALDNTAYGSSPCQRSRFDPTDYGLLGDGNPEERLY